MREEDLEHFAVADGLLARIGEHEGGLTDQEHLYLVDRAREELAKVYGTSLEDAGRALLVAGDQGDVAVRAGEEFATVIAWGRILVVYARVELRGRCHPEAN